MKTIGGMEIVTPLSTGGMGRVLLAKRTGAFGFEKLVAVKVIRGDLVRFQQIRSMFLDEARVLSNLAHPAVAQVYDFGEDRGRLFLAMEFVSGIPLHQFLKLRDGPMPPQIAARIVAEVCRGLHAAHRLTDLEGTPLGVVHRDISPHNLMLTFDGKVKILDFGIALVRDREADETQTGLMKGKISYVAPEQIDGEAIDRRADVYSASVVLHELLTGRALFGGLDDPIATALARRDVKRPSESADVPPTLDEITLKGLSIERDDRFEDARAMAKALDAYLAEAGGESLEDFAERELAQACEQHRAWLRNVLGGAAEMEERTEVDRIPLPPPTPKRAPVPLPPPEPVMSPRSRYGLGRGTVAFAALAFFAVVATIAFATSPGAGDSDSHILPAELEGDLATDLFEDAEITEEPEPETDGDSRAPKLATRRAAEPRQRNEAYGSISIGARSGGWIYVGGKPFGRTPLTRARISSGKHVVALRRPGDRRPRWISNVTIRPGRHVKINLR